MIFVSSIQVGLTICRACQGCTNIISQVFLAPECLMDKKSLLQKLLFKGGHQIVQTGCVPCHRRGSSGNRLIPEVGLFVFVLEVTYLRAG